jgi:P-type Ca2+ transporter type 2C
MGKGGQDEGRKPGSDPPGSDSSFPAWARSVEECEAEFKVSAEHGLRSDEALSRRSVYGWNELEKHSGPSIWQLVLEQFNDTLVRILLVAAVVSFVLAWYF